MWERIFFKVNSMMKDHILGEWNQFWDAGVERHSQAWEKC